jgi:hypothetical protein
LYRETNLDICIVPVSKKPSIEGFLNVIAEFI